VTRARYLALAKRWTGRSTRRWQWNFGLARAYKLADAPSPGGPIRVFGVGLLAVAAIAAAGFWFKRRRESLLIPAHGHRKGDLDGLRSAGL